MENVVTLQTPGEVCVGMPVGALHHSVCSWGSATSMGLHRFAQGHEEDTWAAGALGNALHRPCSLLLEKCFENGKAVFDGIREQHLNFCRRKFFDNSFVHRSVVYDDNGITPGSDNFERHHKLFEIFSVYFPEVNLMV